MKSKEDFLNLLNYSKKLVYGDKAVPFTMKHIKYHCNPKANPKRYIQFSVKKKSGADRTINAPNKGLKAIQKSLNLILQTIYDVNQSANGFVPGRSIVDNAKIHIGSRYVYNIDLKDFFPSIEAGRISNRFQKRPFNLNNETGRKDIATTITWLCCHEMEVKRLVGDNWEKVTKFVLPQGAPTSPTISNIICHRLDFYLTAVAKRFGLKYTRYADDITFSSEYNVFKKDNDFLMELHRIIENQHFNINESKTRLQKLDYRQEVTGLLVNKKVNVPKRYIKQLRMWIYYWENYGYDKANALFIPIYTSDNVHTKKGQPNMANVIAGKLNYLKMVKGGENQLYLKMKERFDKLVGEKEIFVFKTVEINKNSFVNHKPLDTVKFLKSFKYDNSTSFKSLVHRPIDESKFDYLELLKTANNQFLELSQTKDNKINLPKHLMKEVQSFFKILSTVGLDFYTKNRLHPLEDKYVGSIIQSFKQDYRFGNESSESSILSKLISNIIEKRKHVNQTTSTVYSFGNEDTSGLFKRDQIIFNSDLQKFQSKANFFTWVPNLRLALILIFEAILKHSNVNGSRSFDTLEKKIILEIKRSSDGELIKIDFSILDQKSIFLGDLNNILSDMRRDFFPLFVSVCDFKVQFKNPSGENFECMILPYSEKVKEISEVIDGFKYIFTFYD